ncbi:BnaCnng48500D [Brassica napus]|uniref:BnaCnng48500D protein n=1 Tax=Brassica napus TaxID=3708 RepID=A0A078JIX6_BRANA|nr:BnaCnng48500D [Brassica napus]
MIRDLKNMSNCLYLIRSRNFAKLQNVSERPRSVRANEQEDKLRVKIRSDYSCDSTVGSLIRIEVIHLVSPALPLLGPFLWYAVTGSSGEVVNHQTEASSQWFTYTSDMLEDSASSGRSSSNHLDQPAGEREARAQEHARISAEIERIMAACENEEAAMIRKAHNLLHQLGITLEDAEDVKRALQLALHDDWEHDIDDRKRHFTVLRRNFGTARCERWNSFIEELRGLGNHQVNARHYLD